MKTIELIPSIDACDFPSELENEMVDNDISTHYNHDIIFLDWDDNKLPLFKIWLVNTYTEKIKQYESFAICAT